MKKTLLVGSILSAFQSVPAWALEGDTFRPFVSFSQYYDDNLFRLDKNEIINLDGKTLIGPREDSYSVLSAGLNVDWRPKRQQVLARATKSLVRYSNFDSFNYDGSDYLAQWNWRLGNYWNGRIGATETSSQSSFADLNTSVSLKNQRTVRNTFASAIRQVHPRWQVGGGVNHTEVTNSNPAQTVNDYTEQAEDVNLTWRTPKGTSIKTQLRIADAEFGQREFGFVDNSYTQKEVNVSAVWPYSGLLRFQGRLGYEKREHKNVSQRDFSGVTGRGTADYSPSGKTTLSVSVYRELSPSSEISSSYRLATGIAVNAVWTITSKIALRGGLSGETADFQGDPGFILSNTPVRKDKSQNASLSVNYMPLHSTVLGLGVQTGRRDSNNDAVFQNDYEFNTIFANVRMDF